VTFTSLVNPRGRILLIDDDADAALFVSHVLTTRGQFAVTHTADPVMALRLTARGACDLVLTETDLPGPDLPGPDLIETDPPGPGCQRLIAALRQIAPHLPVVVLTAHLLCRTDADKLRNLADAYLEKPVPADRLVAVVTATLTASAQHRTPEATASRRAVTGCGVSSPRAARREN